MSCTGSTSCRPTCWGAEASLLATQNMFVGRLCYFCNLIFQGLSLLFRGSNYYYIIIEPELILWDRKGMGELCHCDYFQPSELHFCSKMPQKYHCISERIHIYCTSDRQNNILDRFIWIAVRKSKPPHLMVRFFPNDLTGVQSHHVALGCIPWWWVDPPRPCHVAAWEMKLLPICVRPTWRWTWKKIQGG